MKILLGHKYFHQIGGAETYFLSLISLLKSYSHDISIFSMSDPNNIHTKWNKYFVSNIDLHNQLPSEIIKSLKRLFSNTDSITQINRLLDTSLPQLAHFQSLYFHLPMAILKVLSQRQIPVVYTVHDYHLISSNPNLIFSLSPTRILLALSWIYHKVLTPYDRYINVYISPSLYLRQKLISAGISPRKIIHLPNFISMPDKLYFPTQEYILFAGRLTTHKGVLWVLNLAQESPHIPFVFCGHGPLSGKLIDYAKRYPNITYIPFTTREKLFKLISKAVCLVIPSLWPENQPYSILEAYIHQKPVIATRIGGIPEIVIAGKTGLLVTPHNSLELSRAIDRLWQNKKYSAKLGHQAYLYAKEKFNPRTYYQKLNHIYQQLLNKQST